MTDAAKIATLRTESDGQVLRIEVDNVVETNAFTPEMMDARKGIRSFVERREARSTGR